MNKIPFSDIRGYLTLIGLLVVIYLLLFRLPDWLDRSDEKQQQLLDRKFVENGITKQEFNDRNQQVTTSIANYTKESEVRNNKSDSMLMALEKKLVGRLKNVESHTEIIATEIRKFNIPVTTTIQDGDTIQEFHFSDEWIPRLDGKIKDGNLILDYEIKQGFDVQRSWKKMEGLWKPKELVIYVTATNPHVRTDKVQTFHFVDKIPWWERKGTRTVKDIFIGIGGFVAGTQVK